MIAINLLQAALSVALATLLIASLTNQAQAAQINASLIPEFDRANGSFVGVKFVQMVYSPDIDVSDIFNGRTERIEFSVKSTNSNGVKDLIEAANQSLLNAQSPV